VKIASKSTHGKYRSQLAGKLYALRILVHATFQHLTSACLDLLQTCRLIQQFNDTSTLALALLVSACSLQQSLLNVLLNVLLQDNGNDQVMHAKSLCFLRNGIVHDALSDLAQQGLV